MPKKRVIGKCVSIKFTIMLLVWHLKFILYMIQDTFSLGCLEQRSLSKQSSLIILILRKKPKCATPKIFTNSLICPNFMFLYL